MTGRHSSIFFNTISPLNQKLLVIEGQVGVYDDSRGLWRRIHLAIQFVPIHHVELFHRESVGRI
jgi:hypothetical protein